MGREDVSVCQFKRQQALQASGLTGLNLTKAITCLLGSKNMLVEYQQNVKGDFDSLPLIFGQNMDSNENKFPWKVNKRTILVRRTRETLSLQAKSTHHII